MAGTVDFENSNGDLIKNNNNGDMPSNDRVSVASSDTNSAVVLRSKITSM